MATTRSSKDSHLYGEPRPRKASKFTPSTNASNLAFSTALSSLIQSSSSSTSALSKHKGENTANTSGDAAALSSRTMAGRIRPSRKKEDIFSVHNRNASKRAAADMLAHDQDIASRYQDGDRPMDDASWKRTKRKMEEKARLYSALKRGDIEDAEERHMVDFDRKWAENEEKGEQGADETSSDEYGSDSDNARTQELVEFEDEFGRTRQGTRADAAREERRKKGKDARLVDEPDRFTARPAQPNKLIFGDTIQSAAFRPDEETTTAMEELAAKRDRELTPPDALHYDAAAEVRSRGTGFFKFSKDEEERQEQMRNLEAERLETERKREELDQRDLRVERRKKEVEERRKVIAQKRGKVQADKFLESLGSELERS